MDSATTTANSKVIIDVLANDTDADNDDLTISTFDSTSMQGGTVSLVDGKLSYIPAADFTGTDSFTYTIDDGRNGKATAIVTIQVTASNNGNHDPIAAPDYPSTGVDTKTIIDVLANDTDSDEDTLTITRYDQSSTKGGTISLVNGKLSYIPAAGFTGTDTFTYTVADGHGGTDEGTVTVTVGEANTNNVPDDDSYDVKSADLDGQGSKGLDVLTGDQYTGTVSIRITSGPSLGTITNVDAAGNLTGSTVTYKPNAKTSGTDHFTYVLVGADGSVSSPATVTINLSNGSSGGSLDAIDDGADGKDASFNFTSAEFASSNIKSRVLPVLDNDSGTTGVNIVAVTQPQFGTAAISADGQSIIYTPRHGYCNDHTFTYTIRDAAGNEDTATVYINID